MKLIVIEGGISGLATAFRVRERFAKRVLPLELCLLEAEDRVGGKIRTEDVEGYRIEWGPNGFLDSKPDTIRLCRDLGIESDLLPSNDAARKRYVFSEGKLHPVPGSPLPFFRSPLLSLRGRLRILKEPWVARTPPGIDTSVAEFGRRRLGREAAEKLLDPMVSGIFAGDPAIMSLRASFPRIAELEAIHGSLIRALAAIGRRRKREAREEGTKEGGRAEGTAGGPAGPGGVLTSFAGGLEVLTRTLEDRLGAVVRRSCRVQAVHPQEEGGRVAGYRVGFEEQGVAREMFADAVILAVPGYDAACILAPADREVSGLLAQIPYAPLVVVGLGFRAGEEPGPLDGFGFLVPYREGTPLLGSLWTSSIFPDRAPPGHHFTRNMVGGWRNGHVVGEGDEDLERRVLDVFELAWGSRGRVHRRRLVRHARAIPLYVIGHEERLARAEAGLGRLPGLYLTGNAYRGVSLNDCTREADRVARQVEEAEVGRMGGASGGGS